MVIKRFINSFVFLFFAFVFLVNTKDGFVASGTISVQPLSGSYSNGETFDVSIRVDGGGTALNASKANVAVSESLQVENVILGDCGFAFVTTPSITSLSYAGVILGGSVNSCTVYRLKLKVISGSNGFVFISDGSIKSYDNSEEIFSKVNNSSYSFEGTTQAISSDFKPSPTQAPIISNSNGSKYYTLIYGVTPPGKSQVENLKVVLDQDQPNEIIVVPAPSSQDPTIFTAVFDNVEAGVHTIDVLENEESISQEVVNIEGQDREISLGVAPKPSTSILWYALAGIVLLVVVSIGVIATVFILKKRKLGQL